MRSLFAVIAPGMLVAATGVGAGDLATASFTGSHLGTAILWAVLVGAYLKFVVTEGVARWQLATQETLLEGVVQRLGHWVGWLFLPYLIVWSILVALALMSACGVTLHAIIPLFDDAVHGKIAFAIAASLLGIILVWVGGFPLFEKIMSVCIAMMFAIVVVTAGLLWPGTGAVVRGILIPSIPGGAGPGLTWTIALMGGVGGTVTVLCYGYWIREKGRDSVEHLRVCRLDLAVGYLMTALFGLAMVIIGSTIQVDGGGARLLVELADRLETMVGPWGRWIFLIGALGAVFSSLLGVWQAVPYLFADLWRLLHQRGGTAGDAVDTRSTPYRAYLIGIAIVPMMGLPFSFREVQKIYAVSGAAFIPALAVVLLLLNGRRAWLGPNANRWPTTAGLLATLAVSAWFVWTSWIGAGS